MKIFSTLTIALVNCCLVSTAIATDLNGRINVISNDGTNYKIMLQINTDVEAQELGGATIILNYDKSEISFPSQPNMSEDFVFHNFNQGYYDEATVTKVTDNQIWLNVDLISDENGSLVTGGPYEWTNLVTLNFESNRIIDGNAVFWDINSSYWGVYGSDNMTIWGIGNFDNLTTSVENEIIDNQLNSFILNQNYPNPFNPSTSISWQSPKSEWQTLKVFDILGNEVATLVDEYKSTGNHSVEFNASIFTSGVYFYQLKAGEIIVTKKMILLR